MKILHLSPELPPAPVYGVGRFVDELVKEEKRLGHAVHVLVAPADPGRDRPDVHYVKYAYPFDAYNGYLQSVLESIPMTETLLDWWSKTGGFEALVTHDWSTTLAAHAAKRNLPVAVIAFVHQTRLGRGLDGTPEEAYVAEMERWAWQNSDRVIAASPMLASELVNHYRIDPNDIGVCLPGASCETFQVQVDADDFREMFARPDERLILYAGRLSPEKGVDVLIEAIALLAPKVPVRLAIAGDGPLRDRLEAQVVARRLKDKVRFAGHVGTSVLASLYRVSDVLAVPSRYEPCGLVALEAASLGLPVVASRTGTLVQLSHATLAEPGNPLALAQAIQSWPARRSPALENSWVRTAEKTIREYESALAGTRA